MKKRIILISIIFAMSLIFVLPQKQAKAATLPSALFGVNGSILIMQVSDLGTLGGSEWALVIHTEWPTPVNIGLGIRYYLPSSNEFAIAVIGDTHWAQHGYYGVWSGSGSFANAINPFGNTWSESFTTSPP